MFATIVAVPAYGRDYKSKAEVLKDWNDGKDFQHAASGQYLSKRDQLTDVFIRYHKLAKVVQVG